MERGASDGGPRSSCEARAACATTLFDAFRASLLLVAAAARDGADGAP